MAIEIKGSGANHTPLVTESQKQQVQAQQQSNAVQPAQPAAGNSGDQVNLTGTASQLRALEQQLVSQPVVDTQRVAAIRHEINSGQYNINPERIADKMIRMESLISQHLG